MWTGKGILVGIGLFAVATAVYVYLMIRGNPAPATGITAIMAWTSMHMDDVPKSLAAAVGVDLTLSKIDGITNLGEHLNALLEPPPADLHGGQPEQAHEIPSGKGSQGN